MVTSASYVLYDTCSSALSVKGQQRCPAATQLSPSTALFVSGRKSIRGANLSHKKDSRKATQMLSRGGLSYQRPWQVHYCSSICSLFPPGCSGIWWEWLVISGWVTFLYFLVLYLVEHFATQNQDTPFPDLLTVALTVSFCLSFTSSDLWILCYRYSFGPILPFSASKVCVCHLCTSNLISSNVPISSFYKGISAVVLCFMAWS